MTQHGGNSYKSKKGKYLSPYRLCSHNQNHVFLGFVLGFLLSQLFLPNLDFYQFMEINVWIVIPFIFLFIFFVRSFRLGFYLLLLSFIFYQLFIKVQFILRRFVRLFKLILVVFLKKFLIQVLNPKIQQ